MITQKIDADDDILGAYHEWARHIAKNFEKFFVICLFQGRVNLPQDIRIFSLGKEKRRSKVLYIKNFYNYIWSMRNEYDAVFVHMNPIYVVLGFIPWRIMGKKICMWYAHPERNVLVKLAYFLCDRVITSVPEAFYAEGKKVIAIGQGIDTDLFRNMRKDSCIGSRILFLGRISPAKRIHTLLEGAKLLKNSGRELSVKIVGNPSETYGGKAYYEKMQEFIKKNNLEDVVCFEASLPNRKSPEIYNISSVFVNLSPTGYFDKTVLEAMSSERVVLASNEAYRRVFPEDLHKFLLFAQDDAMDLAKKIRQALDLSPQVKASIGKRLREIVKRDHSLFTLGKRLKSIFEQI